MELKVFVGENPNTNVKGCSSAGTDVYFGTVVPDHVGENYAFIKSCEIVGGNLELVFDKKPTGVDITKVTIGGIDIPVTWDDATKKVSGAAGANLIAMFANVGGNTDSLGTGGATTTPPIPNNTTFVSADVITNANPNASGTGIIVTLSDDKGYASVTSEWEVKINGTVKPLVGVDGHNTNKFTLGFNQAGAIKAGDVVTVSHIVADSGIVKFIDKPVTNSLT